MLRARNGDTGEQTDIWDITQSLGSPPWNTLTNYGPVTTALPFAAEAVTFALRSLNVHQGRRPSATGLIEGAPLGAARWAQLGRLAPELTWIS